MEKILIVSDTHGRLTNYRRLLDRMNRLDLVIHLGDMEGQERLIEKLAPCPVEMIAGNNDLWASAPKEKEISVGTYRAFLTHGHRYRVDYGDELLIEEARKRDCGIVMCGHTHAPYLHYYPDVTVINPGSISYPRPMTKKPSYILMEIDREQEAHFTIGYIEDIW